MKNLVKDIYGVFFEEALINELIKVGVQKKLNAGDVLMEVGDDVLKMPLLLDGAVKILRPDSNGDEILLYFIESGDTCAMSFNCCMGNSKSKIRAIAETETLILLIPKEKMDEWLVKYKSWRSYILESYQTRLNEVLGALDMLAFKKMDERLLAYLQDKTKINHDTRLHITHHEIANDLNTSRVVISRLLKKLENNKDVILHRKHIDVVSL
jgi:CRP/FNR family transcriptional regulator